MPDVGLVGFHRALVRVHCILILPHAHINVRRHVYEVSGLRRVVKEAVGGGQGQFRLRACLEGVNI